MRTSLGEIFMSVRYLCTLLLIVLVTGCQHDYEPKVLNIEAYKRYLLDTGDVVRVIVFEQKELTETYTVDASGRISVPLAGLIRARDRSTYQVEKAIEVQLEREEFVKDPKVSVEVVKFRPFFIHGEVKTAGKYPYENNITVETAIAIAGGYTDRAAKKKVRLSRRNNKGEIVISMVPTSHQIRPGDTIEVQERWF